MHSRDDPVEKYIPALAGTFYGWFAIRDAADMTAGDRALHRNSAPRGGGDPDREYNAPVMRRGVRVGEPAAHGFA